MTKACSFDCSCDSCGNGYHGPMSSNDWCSFSNSSSKRHGKPFHFLFRKCRTWKIPYIKAMPECPAFICSVHEAHAHAMAPACHSKAQESGNLWSRPCHGMTSTSIMGPSAEDDTPSLPLIITSVNVDSPWCDKALEANIRRNTWVQAQSLRWNVLWIF